MSHLARSRRECSVSKFYSDKTSFKWLVGMTNKNCMHVHRYTRRKTEMKGSWQCHRIGPAAVQSLCCSMPETQIRTKRASQTAAFTLISKSKCCLRSVLLILWKKKKTWRLCFGSPAQLPLHPAWNGISHTVFKCVALRVRLPVAALFAPRSFF